MEGRMTDFGNPGGDVSEAVSPTREAKEPTDSDRDKLKAIEQPKRSDAPKDNADKPKADDPSKRLEPANVLESGAERETPQAKEAEPQVKNPQDKLEVPNEANHLPEQRDNTSQFDRNAKTGERDDVESPTGGRYGDLKKLDPCEREGMDAHHMPADSASSLDKNDGPAILMDKDDHKRTASYDRLAEADDYRAAQKDHIDNGRFRDAYDMDVADIRDKFGDKYDDAIAQSDQYLNRLEAEGRI
jgi:hypothetical protein